MNKQDSTKELVQTASARPIQSLGRASIHSEVRRTRGLFERRDKRSTEPGTARILTAPS